MKNGQRSKKKKENKEIQISDLDETFLFFLFFDTLIFGKFDLNILNDGTDNLHLKKIMLPAKCVYTLVVHFLAK